MCSDRAAIVRPHGASMELSRYRPHRIKRSLCYRRNVEFDWHEYKCMAPRLALRRQGQKGPAAFPEDDGVNGVFSGARERSSVENTGGLQLGLWRFTKTVIKSLPRGKFNSFYRVKSKKSTHRLSTSVVGSRSDECTGEFGMSTFSPLSERAEWSSSGPIRIHTSSFR